MSGDRDLTAVYVILGKALLSTEIFDPKGAFVLLHSIAEGMGDRAPATIDIASHLHVVAALGNVEAARRDARRSFVHIIAILEQRLVTNTEA